MAYFKIVVATTEAAYQALVSGSTVDANTLYFCEDTNNLFFGADQYAADIVMSSASTVAGLPAPTAAMVGKIYITTDGMIHTTNGSTWQTLGSKEAPTGNMVYRGIIDDASDFMDDLVAATIEPVQGDYWVIGNNPAGEQIAGVDFFKGDHVIFLKDYDAGFDATYISRVNNQETEVSFEGIMKLQGAITNWASFESTYFAEAGGAKKGDVWLVAADGAAGSGLYDEGVIFKAGDQLVFIKDVDSDLLIADYPDYVVKIDNTDDYSGFVKSKELVGGTATVANNFVTYDTTDGSQVKDSGLSLVTTNIASYASGVVTPNNSEVQIGNSKQVNDAIQAYLTVTHIS